MNLQRIEVDQSEPAIRRSLKKARPNPLLITKKGKPHAVLVPIPNTDLETASLSLNPNFLAILERSRRSLAEQGGISADEMEARFNQT